MSESIERTNLNFLTNGVDRVSESKRLREAHDQDYHLPKLKQKKSKRHQEDEAQDDFERESSEDENDEQNQLVKKNGIPPRCDGPGLLIDVTA